MAPLRQQPISEYWKQEILTNTSNPVNGDALHSTDASRDDVLPPRLITLGPRNPVQAHVGPVHRVVACET